MAKCITGYTAGFRAFQTVGIIFIYEKKNKQYRRNYRNGGENVVNTLPLKWVE